MYIIGCDPGTRNLGIAVYDCSNRSLVFGRVVDVQGDNSENTVKKVINSVSVVFGHTR